MYKIQWGSHTQKDFRRLRDFLKQKNPHAANKIRPTIKKNIELLLENPQIGTDLEDSLDRRIWRIPFGQNNYVLYYTLDHKAKVIRILRIWHSRESRDVN